MKRRFFMGLIASLPAACVPTKPSYATKRNLNAQYGKMFTTPPARLSFTRLVPPMGNLSPTEFTLLDKDGRRWWPIEKAMKS